MEILDLHTVPGVPVPAHGSTGFTADDWTAVVDDILAEIGAQQQINSFYYGTSNSLSCVCVPRTLSSTE